MQFKINDQTYEFEEVQTIEMALNQLNKLDLTGIAIAINNVVIPKIQWKEHFIQHQDEILIVTATQGG
ncbi:MAG: sulfur carrier protein ThiS [Saprospiraceae bacterium]|nr:sulfur carrier protein ThiS [Saprospiraceae bacterium]